MGGPLSTTTVDQRLKAIACLANPRLAARVSAALADAGFDVSVADVLTDVTEVVETAGFEGLTVLVFDESHRGWLGIVARLTGEHPALMPFLIADIDGPDTFLSALSAGVAGFCHADASGDAVVRAIRDMIEDGVAIPRPFVAPLVEEVRRGRGRVVHTAAGEVIVTDREWDTLQMLMQGRSTREISDALFVSVGTVRSHVSTLLKKIGAIDRDDAVAMIRRSDRSAD